MTYYVQEALARVMFGGAMTISNPIFVWTALGIILMLAELIIPGGVVILLGAACLIVALATAIGLVSGLAQSLTLWFITSIILLLAFRSLTQKLIGGDAHVDNTDEQLDLFLQPALVKQTIGPGQQQGRVEFQGSDWPALGDGSEIPAGSKVKVIYRDNIALVVEPLDD